MTDTRALYAAHITRHWPDAGRYLDASAVPDGAAAAQLKREKKSHCGIGGKTALKALLAEGTDQAYLDELCELAGLQYLDLDWPTTAKDLSPLKKLRELRFLRIDSPRNIDDFTPLLELPKLEALLIENAKAMTTLDWLKPLAPRLRVFGIEGSRHTDQRIQSLEPLRGFQLEALLLRSTRIEDQDLAPLHSMVSLRLLNTALNAPRSQFKALERALPGLECDWFYDAKWKGFRDPRPPKA
ncbi:hypothetical protein [Erythrobacter sp. F6033]|uniref:hypothetical protein n=1 Tax=Erythrobacter sp. F6033 TaxID=2926401 RepID=UPI001FF2ED8D|nr:hypothetical protein [Erythrobacter sp. F6033]MCK0129308.1 hypothetical protein [Erythrobacter sp. F6033]